MKPVTGATRKAQAVAKRLRKPAALFAVVLVGLTEHELGAQGSPDILAPALQEIFTRGVEAQKAGRLEAAEQAFLRVLREGGEVAFVHNNLGIVYQQRGDHARAIAHLRKATHLEPNYGAPRLLLGVSLLATGNALEAARELERAVRLLPQEPLARLHLAKAYQRVGKLPEAVMQLRELRKLAPDEPEYSYQLGQAYLKLAGWCFQQMVKIDPRSARAFQIMAENYWAQGQTELALRTYQRAAQADPLLPGIHLACAQIHLSKGQWDAAYREIEQELALVPESVVALAVKRSIEARRSTAPR